MLSLIYQSSGNLKNAAEARQAALDSKENGAQCLEFLKQREPENLPAALPFLRLRHLKNRLLTGGSKRLTRFFRAELEKCLN